MATVKSDTAYWEEAQKQGFDLSWLEQLKNNVPGDDKAEVSENLTGRVEGSIPRAGIPQIGAYPFRTKKEVWAYNLTKLYNEFVTRQWSSATDIPWETLKPLPDDIEAAECQLATFFTQVEFVASDVPGRFISTMSPDYHEVRQVLLGQVMDESRHLDVFRKRALANGGGLMRMVDAVSDVVGGNTDSARDYTELSTRLHITGEGNVLTLFRMGELMAYNEAEKVIYRRCAQDEARHVAIGVLHARYMHECTPERIEEINFYLDEGEARQSSGAAGDNPAARNVVTSEALAVLLGGGKDKIDEGQNVLKAVRQRQVKEYFQRLKSAGFGDRITNGRVSPALLEVYNPN